MSRSLKKRIKQFDKIKSLNSDAYHIDCILKSAKDALLAGDKGLASALLVNCSQYCEDNYLIKDSIKFLVLAERLLNE